MLASSLRRAPVRQSNAILRRYLASKAPPTTNVPAVDSPHADAALEEVPEQTQKLVVQQAPNRMETWAKSQRPRSVAMTGPRFEQMIAEVQPAPYAAIELIHKQPVRWTAKRRVSCDGGGGPLGHPRIFINVDKPTIEYCNYCGVPYANEHHRHDIEAMKKTARTDYPLDPIGDAAEVPVSQSITEKALETR